MNYKIKLFAIFAFLFATTGVGAMKGPSKNEIKTNFVTSRADCQPGQAQIDMEINNVRARLLTSGDVWWDLSDGKYIVPKPAPGFPEVSALYAGGVWIGGLDPVGNLKLAGVQYRNTGNTDWYPGPLDDEGRTEKEICDDWDEFFVVNGDNIRKHVALYNLAIEGGRDFPCDSIAEDVKYWPGKGNPFFGEKYDFSIPNQNLGNFWDEEPVDGIYNPCDGDFPLIDIRDCEPETRTEALELIPDEMTFWVYNDEGGPHRLSQAIAIQMEVQVQAFAYATNDEINDMTFYRYKLLNKATDDIRSCYFAMWVDPDLGCSEDDYIGCDVERSMAYVYNEDAIDGNPGSSCNGVNTYGDEIPAVGIDYFRGPRGPKVFCRDDNDELILDSLGNVTLCEPEIGTNAQDTLVELGMTSFIYQNRQNAGGITWPEPTTDPDRDFEFYNILQGFWKDGTPLTFGNSGFDPTSMDSVRYAFPGEPSSDSEWSMCTADLEFGDRRTVQATGPLLLQPGATNELIIGVVFAPNLVYDCPDISRLQVADDLAQALFNSCFDIVDGPDAPDMCAVELNQQLVLLLSNDTLELESNNFKQMYTEADLLATENEQADSLFRFEGYKLYQLQNPNVTVQELDDVALARLIRQVDVKNDVTEIFNWELVRNPDPASEAKIYVPERQVNGADAGILHSFNITQDQFSDGDKRLVNHRNYYFTVVAYGYNNYKQFDPYSLEEDQGQQNPYLEGRKNVKTYTFTPRPIVYQDLKAAYGQEAVVTRIEGVGTGLNALDMADGEHESILDGSFDGEITYKPGFAPINAKIVDPLNIRDGEYRLEIVGDYNDNTFELDTAARWKLTNLTTGQIIGSEQTITELNEQLVYGEGFSISVNQVGAPGEMFNDDNGAIAESFVYADGNGTDWFDAVPAQQGKEVENPDDEEDPFFVYRYLEFDTPDDPRNELATIGNGFFVPLQETRFANQEEFYLTPTSILNHGFAINENPSLLSLRLEDLNNVDIVFTSDKTKWSECVVIESGVRTYQDAGLAFEGDVSNWELRGHASIDKEGNEIAGSEGKSYFPGYAIDVETGQRLNIFFGENSVYNAENQAIIEEQLPGIDINTDVGADMIWNPSTELFATGDIFGGGVYNSFAGGQHYIYVTRMEYDGCASIHEQLSAGGTFNFKDVLGNVTWTALPVPQQPLLPLSEGLIPNDLTVKMRVTTPFGKEKVLPNPKKPIQFEVTGGLPVYEFAFDGVQAEDIAEANYGNALDSVQVVPNPYYAYSAYEQDQFSNIVKVTNLPPKATVTIYTLDGKFIQQFNRDAAPSSKGGSNPAVRQTQINPSIEWNLNNSKGIPVASGVYIFHIVDTERGLERSIKWFGVNRRFDPTGL